MADNFTEGTGTITLVKVTPVIRALFNTYGLMVGETDPELAYIGYSTDHSGPQWDDIHQELISLIKTYGLSFPADSDRSICECLSLLIEHFKCNDDPYFENIDNCDFEDVPNLQILFDLAVRFDDGHGIEHIDFEECWYCSKLRAGEFGGCGHFISRHVNFSLSSQKASSVFQPIHDAINHGNLADAAYSFHFCIEQIFNGIVDPSIRKQIRQNVIDKLMAS